MIRQALTTSLIPTLLFLSLSCGGASLSVTDDNSNSDQIDLGGTASESETTTQTVQHLVYNFSDATLLLSHSESLSSNALTTDSSTANVEIILDKISIGGQVTPAITLVEEEVDEESSSETEEIVPSAIKAIVTNTNGNIYIVYEYAFYYDGENLCAFFKVTSENSADCVDGEVTSISNANTNIQFADSDTIFYQATALIDGAYQNILRKQIADGTVTDITNEYIAVLEYTPLSDGSVIVYGLTKTTAMRFLRHYQTDNSINEWLIDENLVINKLFRTSDETIYVSGYWPESDGYKHGISKINPESSSLTTVLINQSVNTDPDYDGYQVDKFYETEDGAIYFLEDNAIFKLSPGDAKQVYSVNTIIKTESLSSTVTISGVEAASTHVFEQFSFTDESTNDLFSAVSDEIEIYDFALDADGLVYFTGLRFSDNQVVVGQIDPNNENMLTYDIELSEEPVVFEVVY